MTIREEIELDITPADRSLDELENALESIAQSFQVDLASALDILQNIVIEEVDTSAISESINEAAAGTDLVVDVDAETSEAQEEINSLSGEDVDIIVDADTSPAQEEIDELGASADVAATGVGGLSDATGVLTGAAAGAAAPVSELFNSIEGGSGATILATGAVASLAFGFGVLLPNAVESVGTMQAFTARTGEAAAATELLEERLFGAETTIGDLARSMGSNDEAVRNSVARLFAFAEASEFSSGRAEQFSENVLALATRAVALNPSLGDISTVVDGLSTGLSRGGRRLANYGIEITRTEIETRALANSGKLLASQLSEVEKQEAGAQIATERLGAALGTDIQDNLDNVTLTFASFQKTVEDTLEEIGKPLIFPMFDTIEAGIPIVLSFAEILADISGGLVSFLAPVAEGLEGPVDILEESVDTLVNSAGPGLEDLGVGLGDLFEDLEPVIESAGDSLEGFGQVVGAVGTTLGSLASLLGDITATLSDFEENITGAINSLPTDIPLGAPDGALARIIDYFEIIATSADPFQQFGKALEIFGVAQDNASVEELSEQIFGAARSSEEFATALESAQGNLADLALEANGGDFDEMRDDFDAAGITASEFAGFLLDGANGAERFNRALQDSGVSEEVVDRLNEAFARQTGFLNEQAEAQVEHLRQSGAFTDAQLDAALAVTQNADGTFNYIAALTELGPLMEQEIARQEAHKATLAANGQSWVNLAQSVISGTIASEDYGAAAEELGVDLSTVETFINSVRGAVDQFAQAAIQQLPQVSAAFEGIEEATSPEQIIENLTLQALAVANFETNIRTLLAFGLDDLAQLALERGPAFTNALIQSFQQGRPGLALELETTLEGTKAQLTATEEAIRNEFAPQLVDAASVAATAATDAYGAGIDFSGVTGVETSTVPPTITAAQPGIEGAAATAGAGATTSFGANLNLGGQTEQGVTAVQSVLSTVFGVSDPLSVLKTAAAGGDAVALSFLQGMTSGLVRPSFQRTALDLAVRGVIADVEGWARDEAESNSPSRLFARLGEDLTSGLALGIESNEQAVVRAAESIVSSAARALSQTTDFATITGGNLGLRTPTASGGSTGGDIHLTVQVTVPSGTRDATAFGEAVAAPVAREVLEQILKAEVSAG